MLGLLGGLVGRHPRRVLAVWVLAVVGLAALGTTTAGRLGAPDLLAGGTDSARALRIVDAHFGRTTAFAVLVRGDRAAVDRTVAAVARAVRGPLRGRALTAADPGAPRQLRAGARTALVLAEVPRPPGRRPDADNTVIRRVAPVVRQAATPGASVALGGTAAVYEELKRSSESAAKRGELLAAPILIAVLLLVLRTPAAALLAALSGGVAVAAGMGVLRGAAALSDLTVFSATLTSMMGLALGVDYALLILFRYREQRAAGAGPEASAQAALTGAGSTVLLAGGVLAVAMAVAVALSDDGLLVSPAIGVLAAAAVAVAGALTALPALLILGDGVLERGGRRRRPSAWAAGLGRAAMRRPWTAIAVVLVPLGVLAAVGLGLRTGPGDVRQLPADAPVRRAVEAIGASAGPGFAAPFELVVAGAAAREQAPLAALTARVRASPVVAAVLGAGERSADGQAWRLRVIPRAAPNTAAGDAARRALVAVARRATVPVLVGGVGAELAQFHDATAAQVPRLMLALTLVGFLALLVVLRAPLLAALSVALNLLTVGVAFGVVALLFQGADPPLGGSGYQEVIAMVSMFTVMFGLSIDYQVFLLHRMREGLAATGDPRSAMVWALDRTAGVVTGAAAIMVGVFLAFSVSDVATIRQFGIGLAVAIAVDATLVRLVLLPAAIGLFGRAAWWPQAGGRGAPAPEPERVRSLA